MEDERVGVVCTGVSSRTVCGHERGVRLFSAFYGPGPVTGSALGCVAQVWHVMIWVVFFYSTARDKKRLSFVGALIWQR